MLDLLERERNLGTAPGSPAHAPGSLSLIGYSGWKLRRLHWAGRWSHPRLAKDRLKKLAEAIEALAEKDNALISKTQEIAGPSPPGCRRAARHLR